MNSITGSAGNDSITGTAAADEIYGGDGNDTIIGGSGNDVIYGGKGTDTVSYSGAYGNFKLTALYEGKNSSFSGFTVSDLSGSEGTDSISSDIEYLTFSSGSVVYKIDSGTVSLVDTAAPTISLTSSVTALLKSETATITFTLSESSTDFNVGDITATGGTLSNFAGSGTTYTALFTPTANSTTSGVVRVASGVFSDAAGNVNSDGSDVNNSVTMTVNTVSLDATPPTIAITSSVTSLSASQTANITFTLSESSSNFVIGDITATGGTLSNFAGSGTTYTALFTPTANSTTSGVVRVASGVFTDAAGNPNADGLDANNSVTMAVNTVPVDTTPPTIAITSSATSLSASQTANITFTLSESSSNFVIGDITATGGTLSNFAGSGTTYTALFTPTANSTTSGVVRVASGVFTDAAGNPNADGLDTNNSVTMTVNTVPVDTTPPTIAISSSATSLSASQTANITFTLSESSSNFVIGDITATGGTLSNFAGSGTTYTALFTPTANSTTSGVVQVASGVFTDAAGNANTDGLDANNSVTMAVNTVPVDTTPPTIAISSSATSLSASQTANITFTLSESSSNFVIGDITSTGGTLSNFAGSGTTYTALFTPTANSTTSGVVRVASGAFTDAAGNVNADGLDANNTITLSVDTVAPTIALSANKTALVSGDSATLTFSLSEASSTFAISDITVTGGTLSNFNGSGSTYSATFALNANSTSSGVINVPNGVFTDAAGNANADGMDTNNILIFTRIASITNETHSLSVIVDQNVLGPSPALLKDLKEYITYTNGVITKHSVEYAGLTFDYNQIDSLITTVTRDGDFTTEFTREINDYLKTELNITYSVAVALVGVASIDSVILSVAGADGNYVG